MTWHTHLKTTQPKKLTQSEIKKKEKPTKLKLTYPTQIKLTLKLNSNSLLLCNKPPYSAIFPLAYFSLSSHQQPLSSYIEWNEYSEEIKETNKRIKRGCRGYKTREWKLHCDLWLLGDLHGKPAYVSTSAFAIHVWPLRP